MRYHFKPASINPSRHKGLNQCWFDVKPTLIQRLVAAGIAEVYQFVIDCYLCRSQRQ